MSRPLLTDHGARRSTQAGSSLGVCMGLCGHLCAVMESASPRQKWSWGWWWFMSWSGVGAGDTYPYHLGSLRSAPQGCLREGAPDLHVRSKRSLTVSSSSSLTNLLYIENMCLLSNCSFWGRTVQKIKMSEVARRLEGRGVRVQIAETSPRYSPAPDIQACCRRSPLLWELFTVRVL